MPLLYMLAQSFESPSQSVTPGAPAYPAARQPAHARASVPDLRGPDAGRLHARPDADQEGRESSVFVDPSDATATRSPGTGPLARRSPKPGNSHRSWTTSSTSGSSSTSPGCCSTRQRSRCSARSPPSSPRRWSPMGSRVSNSRAATCCSSSCWPRSSCRSRSRCIPTYIIFTRIGWNGTWLPLIVPHLFANAFNVFLLRQYFMSIPRDLDEAAMMDGAGPVGSCGR